jgi:hypothetical protein
MLESQRYELHRDLSSWVASLASSSATTAGVNDYGVLLTFTLKDLPNVRCRLPSTRRDDHGRLWKEPLTSRARRKGRKGSR